MPAPGPRRSSGGSSGSGGSGGGGGKFRRMRRKVCLLCVDKIDSIDYKNVGKLRRYVSDRGKILPRRTTGSCASHQRTITRAIKRAREIALLPYTAE